jgi:hypothetical protein
MYADILKLFDDSNDIAFGNYYEVSPLSNTILVFRDNAHRKKFRIAAEKMKMIPTINEVIEGETIEEKKSRIEHDITIINANRKVKLEQNLNGLVEKLSGETDPHLIQNIEKRITRLINRIEKPV